MLFKPIHHIVCIPVYTMSNLATLYQFIIVSVPIEIVFRTSAGQTHARFTNDSMKIDWHTDAGMRHHAANHICVYVDVVNTYRPGRFV